MQQYTHENVRSIPHLPIYCDRYEDYRQFSPRHWHDHIEIIYVVSGSLQVVCGENEYTLKENEFFVINSNKIHGTQSYERVRVLLVQIPYAYLDSYIDDYGHIRFRECYETEQGSRKYEQMKSLLKSIAHIYRKKGKGYELAEKMPAAYHGVGKFDPALGASAVHKPCFSDVFGQTLTELALENPRVCAITAAMRDGTGLKTFSETCPKRYFDVGIAEEHALSMACGMAKQGLIPAVAIYSTFLQRSFDMLLHDLALLQLHVVLGVDRAGLVGEDGRTHHGMFDVGYLRQVPGMKIYCPASFAELRRMLRQAVLEDKGPVAVRYPRGGEGNYQTDKAQSLLKEGKDCTVITYGTTINAVLEAAEGCEKEGLSVEVLKLATIAPLDFAAVEASCRKTGRVLVVEETSNHGCVADELFARLLQSGVTGRFCKQNLGDGFIRHGAMQDLYALAGLTAQALRDKIREVCHEA